MSISVVNGYFCENSCDVAKAKKGEDPHPRTGPETESADGKGGVAGSSRVDGPAVVLGGALAKLAGREGAGGSPSASTVTGMSTASAVSGSSTNSSTAPGSVLNILA